jgi:hypothetical protein
MWVYLKPSIFWHLPSRAESPHSKRAWQNGYGDLPLVELREKTNSVISRQHSSNSVIILQTYLTEEKGIYDYRFQENLDIQTATQKRRKTWQ